MASVYQRSGRPGFFIEYVDAFGVTHKNVPITAETKTEAKRFKSDLEHKIERQRLGLDPLPVTSSITLAHLCDWWLKEVCPRAAEKKERSRLKEITEQPIGGMPLHQLDDAALEGHFTKMEKRDPPARPGTIQRLRSTLGSIFTKARKLKKWTATNPVRGTDPRKPPKGVYLILKPQEISLVLRVLSDWWRDLFATAFYMALRKGELFALRKADVNLEDRELTVQRSHDSDTTKGRKAVVLPVPPPLVPYLEHALGAFPGPLLFPDARGRQRLPTSKPEVVLRRALARAGLITGYRHTCRRCAALKARHVEMHQDGEVRTCPVERAGKICGARLWATPLPRRMKFHELRHSTATLLLRMGVPMAVVQRVLRHANIKLTVDLYGHLDISDMRQAMDRMPEPGQAARRPKKRAQFPTTALPNVRTAEKTAPDPLEDLWKSEALEWSGTPGSNRRPSPWQGVALVGHVRPLSLNPAPTGHDLGSLMPDQDPTGTPRGTQFPTKPLPGGRG
jgi:integrase